MTKRIVTLMFLILLLGGVLTACGSSSAAPGEEQGGEGELPPEAVVRAREALAADLNVDLETIEVVSYERQEWSDSCLGLGGPAESCLAAIHPGWQVMLQVDGGNVYEVRTDETGDIVRINK